MDFNFESYPKSIEKLSGDFNRGYTAALMDISEVFASADEFLRLYARKRWSYKMIDDILHIVIEHREAFRENRHCGFAWNAKEGRFFFTENFQS